VSERLLVTVSEPRRYFLVPRERLDRRAEDPIPAGEFELRAVDGPRFSLSAEDVAVYEVDRGRAIAHVDSGIERLLAPVLDLLPNRDLRVFGVTPGEVVVDPEKRRQGRRTLIEQALRVSPAETPAGTVERVEQRLDSFGDAVRREGQRLVDSTGRLGELLEEQLPTIDAAMGNAEQRVLDFGQQVLASLRDLAGRPAGERPPTEADDEER
jgi:hypothetical protein